jgi:hypothetical protein
MVSEAYTNRWRTFCYGLTLLICALLALRNFFLLLLAPVVVFLVGVFGSIVSKRLFPPPIEDVVSRSKEARYTPL